MIIKTDRPSPRFKPVIFTITCETDMELLALLATLNLTNEELTKKANALNMPKYIDALPSDFGDLTDDLFNIVRNIVDKELR